MKLALIKTAVASVVLVATAMFAAMPALAHGGLEHPQGASAPRHGTRPAAHVDRTEREARQYEMSCTKAFRYVTGLGQSCPTASGLWRVKLADNTTLVTHGPDFDVAADGASYKYDPNAVSRKPVCSTGEAFKAIIAIAPDVASDKTVASFRSDIHALNGILYRAAVESGAPGGSNLKFRCDGTGAVQVDVVRLSTSNGTATFTSITSELKSLGYNKTNEKYVVHYDAQPGTTRAGGTGSFWSDETDSAANSNNVGPSWAVSFDRPGPGILLHEIGHNLGAVQYSAPNSTGSGSHCWEGYDVMCYNDQGDRDTGFIQYNCPDFDHFDCRHDSYFDAKIGAGQGGAAGSYIDKNWNIGECYVRWVQHSACSTSGDVTPPTVTAPLEQIDVPNKITSTIVPVRLTWSGSDASGIAAYELETSTNGGAYVRDANVTTQAVKAYALLVGTRYQFRVRAKDTAGNWSGYQYSQPLTPSLADEKVFSPLGGSWSRYSWASAFGGTAITSSVAGNWVELSFTGRDVALVAPTFSTGGRAKVYCDGTMMGYADLYAATTSGMHTVFWCRFAQSTTHTMKIVLEGTSGRPRFDVDAFAILR